MPDAKETPAVKSLRREEARTEDKRSELDEGLLDTFPASDPVAPTVTTTSGAPPKDGKDKDKKQG